MKYFILVGGALVALMLALFLWGRVGLVEAPPGTPSAEAPASTAPASTGAPTSY